MQFASGLSGRSAGKGKYFLRGLAVANVVGIGAIYAAFTNRRRLQEEGSLAIEMYERFVARVQAMNRARRLVSTVATVAIDYRINASQALLPSSGWEAQLRQAIDDQEKAGLAAENAADDEERAACEELATSARHRILEASENLSRAAVEEEEQQESPLHSRNAERLLSMARANGGVYLKIAQHAAQLDYLLPPAYIRAFEKCLDDAPRSTFSDVVRTMHEEGFRHLVRRIEIEPIASGSLAQVYRGKAEDGREIAVKVQHRGLRETSRGDVDLCVAAVRLAGRIFPTFRLTWLADEIAPHLAIELDFTIEAENCRTAKKHFRRWKDVIVPEVLEQSPRVLVMSYETGVNAISFKGDLKTRRKAAELITKAFAVQTFQIGLCHCDPHGANVLVRPDASVVILDHGLYKKLDDPFRLSYARLWRSILLSDPQGIERHARELGVGDAYPLFAAILTRKPWDDVVNSSSSPGPRSKADDVMTRYYAHKYARQITKVLDDAPRQLLLLLKMTDCLRRLDSALDAGCDSDLVTLHATLDALHAQDRDHLSYARAKFRLWFYRKFLKDRDSGEQAERKKAHIPSNVSGFVST